MAEENPQDNCLECRKKEAAQWRDDFPVNWESDNYVTRREMVKFLALGSTYYRGRQCCGCGPAPYLAGRRDAANAHCAGPFYSSGRIDAILLSHARRSVHSGAAAQGDLVAYSQVCTHLSCAVVYHKKEDVLFCPCHHGYFSIDEGRPFAGPPTRALPRIKLEQQGNEIFAVGVEIA